MEGSQGLQKSFTDTDKLNQKPHYFCRGKRKGDLKRI